MEEFSSLNPDIRAAALVGTYLMAFAVMEGQLNRLIGSALGLKPVQEAIVTRNLQLRDKIKISRCLIDIGIGDADERKRYDKIVESIGTISYDRNIAAHDMFGPDEDGGGVQFLIIKASGKLNFPDTAWSVQDVLDKCENLRSVGEALLEIKQKLIRAEIVKMLLSAPKDPSPIGGLFGLGQERLDAPQPLGLLGSTLFQSNSSTSPQTHQEPED